MTITLPDALKADLERRAKAFGFATADEYVAWLVEDDADPDNDWVPTPEQLGFADQAALEAHLIAALNSGPAVLADEAFWEKRRQELEGVIARHHGRGA